MRRALVLASLVGAAVGAVGACTLNPQPLPPEDLGAAKNSDASTARDSSFGAEPTPSADAGTATDGDGDSGDASDSGS